MGLPWHELLNGLTLSNWKRMVRKQTLVSCWWLDATTGLGHRSEYVEWYSAATKRSWTVRTNMMTSSNGNIFRVTGHLCGEFTGPRWSPRTKGSDVELWYFLDLHLNERLRKQPWGWWFEMPSRPLWIHSNEDSASSSPDQLRPVWRKKSYNLIASPHVQAMTERLNSLWHSVTIKRDYSGSSLVQQP